MLGSRTEKVAVTVSHPPDAPGTQSVHPSLTAGPRLVVSNENTDAVLAADALGGDARAFRTLVERHLARTVGLARRLLGSDAETEDVAQEVFVRFWSRLGDLEIGAAGAGPWLRRVTFNLCMDRKRGARDFVPDALETLASDDDQHRMLEERDLSRRVDAALQELPERQRAAIALFHFEGYAMKEIGDTMDVSAEAVESLLGRARRSLKAALADDWQALLPDRTNEASAHITRKVED